MIDELRKVLALSALLSVLVAALFTFGAPVRAEETSSHNSVSSQQQTAVTAQAATTMGVPLLDAADQDDAPVDVSEVQSQD
ncbi:MAG: RebB family R body protein [Hyphomicrobiales bacterium]|jgi:hypothetical protein